MSTAIKDYLTKKPLSRQRKYQLRKRRQGKCIICGRSRSRKSATYCASHLESSRKQQRERYRERWKQEQQ